MMQLICTNYGKCALADQREDFSMERGGLTRCPLCDMPLSKVIPAIDDEVEEQFEEPEPEEAAFEAPVYEYVEEEAPARKTNNFFHVLAFAAVLVLSIFAVDKDWIRAFKGTNTAESKDLSNAILRLSGSNTIGETLAPTLAEAFLKAQGATDVRILPGSSPEDKIVQGILPGNSTPSTITIAAYGTSTAFTSLADNSCDIGMASRKIKPDEVAKLATLGDMNSAASEHILGLDGIAVIVNASNRLSSLRKDEIRRIFSGEITDWAQIGSTHGTINIYAMDNNSGTYDTFKNLVLTTSPLSAVSRRFEDSNALSEAVSSDPDGIGFISISFIHDAKPLAISDRGTGLLQPTRLTIATEEYALSRRLYLYTPAIARNKYTQLFVEFALSQQGQGVLATNGFVAQGIAPMQQAVSKAAPDEYKLLTENAQRIPLDFRFQPGDTKQDNKGEADLDRVVTLIADNSNAGQKILLFGFSDNSGTSDANQTQSLSQAKIIESQLVQRGIKPALVRGFGAALPVASNETADGREKNRRVEVWIRK